MSMTIDEAMTDLSIQLEVKHSLGKNYQAEAIKLGIEALKCIKQVREATGVSAIEFDLPGETK